MPEVPSAPGTFFADPESEEREQLDTRWVGGEFATRSTGALTNFGSSGETPLVLYVPDGLDTHAAAGLLALNQGADSFSIEKVESRD